MRDVIRNVANHLEASQQGHAEAIYLFIYLFEMLDAIVGSIVFEFNKGFFHLLLNFYM
jgi:hypothetical protein